VTTRSTRSERKRGRPLQGGTDGVASKGGGIFLFCEGGGEERDIRASSSDATGLKGSNDPLRFKGRGKNVGKGGKTEETTSMLDVLGRKYALPKSPSERKRPGGRISWEKNVQSEGRGSITGSQEENIFVGKGKKKTQEGELAQHNFSRGMISKRQEKGSKELLGSRRSKKGNSEKKALILGQVSPSHRQRSAGRGPGKIKDATKLVLKRKYWKSFAAEGPKVAILTGVKGQQAGKGNCPGGRK